MARKSYKKRRHIRRKGRGGSDPEIEDLNISNISMDDNSVNDLSIADSDNPLNASFYGSEQSSQSSSSHENFGDITDEETFNFGDSLNDSFGTTDSNASLDRSLTISEIEGGRRRKGKKTKKSRKTMKGGKRKTGKRKSKKHTKRKQRKMCSCKRLKYGGIII